MLNIATINVQNKYKVKGYDGIYKNENHVKMLLELIKKHNLEIIGLQEVNSKYASKLQLELMKGFSYYGKFRFPNNFITKRLYPFSVFNESVPIITNHKILDKKMEVLPWLSSYVPRVVTIMKIDTKELGPIVVLNTHLDYLKNKTKVKQLKRLLEIIQKISRPVILMGDFNMTVKNKDFLEFVNSLQKLNINHINVGKATFKYSKAPRAIDHIFLSPCFRVKEVILDKSSYYANFSDHYPVIVKLSLGFEQK